MVTATGSPTCSRPRPDAVPGPRLGWLSALAAGALISGCASGRSSAPPPSWWPSPPPSTEALYFAGDATGAGEEGLARDLAYQKALTQLSTYLGATITTDFRSLEATRGDVETQEVELAVSVSGSPRTLRRVRLEKIETRETGAGFDAYALVAWPRAEYEAALAAEKNLAASALAHHGAAERAVEARDYAEARQRITAAREALKTVPGSIPLAHETVRDTAVLRTALDALEARVTADEGAQAKVCAVGLRCLKDGAPVACRGSRLGVVRDAVARSGRQLSAAGLPEALLGALLESGSVAAIDARSLGRCLVAVQLTSELIEADRQFTFVRTGARVVLYDSSAGKIVWSDEIAPSKVGHVSYDGAMNKGFDALEKSLVPRLGAAVGAM